MSSFVLIPALTVGLLAGATEPQTKRATPVPQQQQKDKTPLIKVFTLKNAPAAEAAQTIRELITDDVRIVADELSNSLIVSGPEDIHKVVEALLVRLDEPRVNKPDESIFEVIQLRPENTDAVQRAMSVYDGDARLMVDPRTSRLLVSGKPASIRRLKDLIKTLDVPQARPSQPVKMRVIWLTTDKSADEPGPHLKKVIESLDRVGIKGLRQKTQVMANVTEPNSDFSIRGLVGEDTQISVTGNRQGDSVEPAKLAISIDIRPAKRQASIDLSATVSLSAGQMVVLGATPTGEGQSVFVVELIPGI